MSLAPRLPRAALNDLRTRVGLAPLGGDANYAASIVGLDGPRVTPRALLDVVARLAGVDRDRPVSLKATTRQVILDGLRGAAQFGSASALGDRKISALAKTGTAPMPGGSWMGLVVALEPADRPTRGIVVVAPGAAGLDAADDCRRPADRSRRLLTRARFTGACCQHPANAGSSQHHDQRPYAPSFASNSTTTSLASSPAKASRGPQRRRSRPWRLRRERSRWPT